MGNTKVIASGVLLCALAMGVHWNALDCGFAFDDSAAIVDNADSHWNDSSITEVFQNDFWGTLATRRVSHKSYRPIVVLTYRFQDFLHGLSPYWFHFGNNLIHCLVTLMCFGMILELTHSTFGAFAAAAIFAVHPVHVEAVTGIVGRAEELCAVFYILGYYVYRRFLRVQSGIQSVLLLVSFTLCVLTSALSKETGSTLPLLCFAESIIVGGVAKKPVKESFWNRIRWHYILSRLSEVVLVIFVYFLVRINSTVPGGVMTVLFGHEPGDIQDYMRDGEIEFSGWTAVIAGTTTNTRMVENPFAKLHGLSKILSLNYLQAYYAHLLVYPWVLCCEYAFNCIPAVESLSDPRMAGVVAFNVLVVYLMVQAFVNVFRVAQRDLRLMRAMMWTIIPFLTSCNIFIHIGTLVAERLLYVPSIGFCMLVGLAVQYVIGESVPVADVVRDTPPRSLLEEVRAAQRAAKQRAKAAAKERRASLGDEGEAEAKTEAEAEGSEVAAKGDEAPSSVPEAEAEAEADKAGSDVESADSTDFEDDGDLSDEEEKEEAAARKPARGSATGMIVASVFVAVTVAGFGYRTWLRNYDWSSTDKLFATGYDVCPTSSKLSMFRAQEELQRGNHDLALELFYKTLDIDPTMCDVYEGLSLLYLQKSDPGMASKMLRSGMKCDFIEDKMFLLAQGYWTAIRSYGSNATFSEEVASSLVFREMFFSAAMYYLEASAIHLSYGNIAGALRSATEALYHAPSFCQAYNVVGQAFRLQGDANSALQFFLEALRCTAGSEYGSGFDGGPLRNITGRVPPPDEVTNTTAFVARKNREHRTHPKSLFDKQMQYPRPEKGKGQEMRSFDLSWSKSALEAADNIVITIALSQMGTLEAAEQQIMNLTAQLQQERAALNLPEPLPTPAVPEGEDSESAPAVNETARAEAAGVNMTAYAEYKQKEMAVVQQATNVMRMAQELRISLYGNGTWEQVLAMEPEQQKLVRQQLQQRVMVGAMVNVSSPMEVLVPAIAGQESVIAEVMQMLAQALQRVMAMELELFQEEQAELDAAAESEVNDSNARRLKGQYKRMQSIADALRYKGDKPPQLGEADNVTAPEAVADAPAAPVEANATQGDKAEPESKEEAVAVEVGADASQKTDEGNSKPAGALDHLNNLKLDSISAQADIETPDSVKELLAVAGRAASEQEREETGAAPPKRNVNTTSRWHALVRLQTLPFAQTMAQLLLSGAQRYISAGMFDHAIQSLVTLMTKMKDNYPCQADYLLGRVLLEKMRSGQQAPEAQMQTIKTVLEYLGKATQCEDEQVRNSATHDLQIVQMTLQQGQQQQQQQQAAAAKAQA